MASDRIDVASLRKLYFAGDDCETIGRKLSMEMRDVMRVVSRNGWEAERALAIADASAKRLAERKDADEKFRALADAIRSLAVSVAGKAKAGTLKAKDVLDLAKATEIAQRIRENARG